MKTKHTPGPWGLSAAMSSDLHNIRYVNADLGNTYSCIAVVRDRTELTQAENLANARLICAAPNLLASLERLEIQLSYEHAPDRAMLKVMLDDARKSIAEAKGGS